MQFIRQKELSIIKKYFRMGNSSKYSEKIPFVIIGKEWGAGYDIILKNLINDKEGFQEFVYLTGSEYVLNRYFQIHMLMKFLQRKIAKPREIGLLQYWISQMRDNNCSGVDYQDIYKKLLDMLFIYTTHTPLLIICDGLDFCSVEVINFFKRLIDRIIYNKKKNIFQNSQIYFIGSYNVENFLGRYLKNFIYHNKEFGLTFKLYNISHKDFFKITTYSYEWTNLYSGKVWNVCRGNITVYEDLMRFLSIINNALLSDKQKMNSYINSKLPLNREGLYKAFLSILSDSQIKILEVLSIVEFPLDLEAIQFLMKQQGEKVFQDINFLLEIDILRKSYIKSDKYTLFSLEMRNYIIRSYLPESRVLLYKKYLNLVEEYFHEDLGNYIVSLKKMARMSGDIEKGKYYLEMLLKIFAKDLNLSRKVEILKELIILENNPLEKANYLISYSQCLINLRKYDSAVEFLVDKVREDLLRKKQKFILLLMLFRTLMHTNRYYQAAFYLPDLKRIYNSGSCEEFASQYFCLKMDFYTDTGSYEEALKIFNNAKGDESLCNILLIKKCRILIKKGIFTEALSIVTELLQIYEERNNVKIISELLMYKAQIFFYRKQYNESYRVFYNVINYAREVKDFNRQLKSNIKILDIYRRQKYIVKFNKLANQLVKVFKNRVKDKNYSDFYRILFLHYTSLSLYKKAEKAIRIAARIFPGSSNFFFRLLYKLDLAEFYFRTGNKDAGQDVYSELISESRKFNDKDYYEDLINLSYARSALILGEKKSANNILKRVINSYNSVYINMKKVEIILAIDDIRKNSLEYKNVMKDYPEVFKEYFEDSHIYLNNLF